MYIKKAKILNRLGIHGKAASTFAHIATQYDSNVYVERADDPSKKANAKSVVFVLALALAKDDEIIISAEGNDEELAVNALVSCLETLEDQE